MDAQPVEEAEHRAAALVRLLDLQEVAGARNRLVHVAEVLGEGALDDDLVTCPWHGWQYNVKTGVCQTNPDLKVACYEVQVEGGDIKIALP